MEDKYTLIGVMDGELAMHLSGITFDEVKSNMECLPCSDGVTMPECVRGCTTTSFLRNLKRADKAVSVYQDEYGHTASLAFKERGEYLSMVFESVFNEAGVY